MKTRPVKRFTIGPDHYGTTVRVVLGMELEGFKGILQKAYPEIPAMELADAGGLQIMVADSEGFKDYWVWIQRWGEDTQFLGLLCHEVFHLAVRRLQDIGMTLTGESEEAFAYYQQWLFQAILEKCAPKGRGK